MNNDKEVIEAFNAARISDATFKGYSEFLQRQSKKGEQFDGVALIRGILGFTAVSLTKIIQQMDLKNSLELGEVLADIQKTFSETLHRAQSMPSEMMYPDKESH